MKPLFNREASGIDNELILLEHDKIERDDNEFAKDLSDDKPFRHDRK